MSRINIYQNILYRGQQTSFWVDKKTTILLEDQDGSVTRPYATIQRAIDKAIELGVTNFLITVGVGYYGEPINIPQDIGLVINGPINGETQIGDITWAVSGDFLNWPVFSALVIRDCTVTSITINDGITPSAFAVFVLENVNVGSLPGQIPLPSFITQTGTSFLFTGITGLNDASSIIPGVLTSSSVTGNLYLPNSTLALQNTRFDGYIHSSDIKATNCAFGSNIFSNGNLIELFSCNFVSNCQINFVNAGVNEVFADGNSLFKFKLANGNVMGGNLILSELPTIHPATDGYVLTWSDTLGAWYPGPNFNSGGGGVTPTQHETLRQLIHFIDEGPADGFLSRAYKVILPNASIFPTSIIWYVDSSLSQKIIEKTLIWSGVVPTTITWKVYNTDGITVAHTVSDSITYSNNIFESTRTRTIT